MKLIVGLGNFGPLYENTRHNIGFMVLDNYSNNYNLVFKHEKKFLGEICIYNDTIFLKPLTYMNLSGNSVILVKNYYKIDIKDILIISDDLDSPVGRIRLKENGSSGGHNGLKSIFNQLGTSDIKRLKIGISKDLNIPVKDYVLQKFKKEEKEKIQVSINKSKDILNKFIEGEDFHKISSTFNMK